MKNKFAKFSSGNQIWGKKYIEIKNNIKKSFLFIFYSFFYIYLSINLFYFIFFLTFYT